MKVLPFVLIIFLMKSCVSSAESSLMRMENGKKIVMLEPRKVFVLYLQ